LEVYRKLIDEYQHEYGVPVVEIAAALAALAEGKSSLFASPPPPKRSDEKPSKDSRDAQSKSGRTAREKAPATSKPDAAKSQPGDEKPRRKKMDVPPPEKDMQRYRLEVGLEHGVKPGNIVGAIANEAELDSEYIGRIEIYDDYSTVDLPEGMPKELFKHLKKVRVSGQRLDISKIGKDSKVFEDAKSSASKESKRDRPEKPTSKKTIDAAQKSTKRKVEKD
jgi:ATP-dependent RNA helicase DeaD